MDAYGVVPAESLELAWAAGFFDGEGSSHPSKMLNAAGGARCYPTLQIAQVEREPIERFVAAVGVGRVRGPYPMSGDRQPQYKWAAAGSKAQKAMARLWPYLSQPKRDQFARSEKEAASCSSHK